MPARLGCCFWVGLLLVPGAAVAQIEFVETIETSLGDTTETFWAQIPAGYDPARPCPLLIGWHQWGADHMEMKHASRYDENANARGWIVASHLGTANMHWNNHPTQSHVVDVIRWLEDRYSIDPDRIYMVGGSMGGAAGMVFSNNHLDPSGPMVAAAASLSGIQDCERRFHEQGINYSMIEAFGGTPDEAPYEYHRNSAVCFGDSTESMHFNARHLPLWLEFGRGTSDGVWRKHAEDLYAVMAGFADTVVLRESELEGHGWSVHEEELICDFLGQFRLQRHPAAVSINADEEGRWHWTDIRMRVPGESFARLEARACARSAVIDLAMVRNVEFVTVDLNAIGVSGSEAFLCRWAIADGAPSGAAFCPVPDAPLAVLRNGVPYTSWWHDPESQLLTLYGHDVARYQVVFDPSDAAMDSDARRARLPGLLSADDLPRAVRDLPGEWTIYDVTGRMAASLRGAATGSDASVRLPAGGYVLLARPPDPHTRAIRFTIVN